MKCAMGQYGQASAPAAKRYVGRRKSKPCKGMQNGMGITANCISAFCPCGISAASRWSEHLNCSPTPSDQCELHQHPFQLHRRSASLEINVSSRISATTSNLNSPSEYSSTATHTNVAPAFASQKTSRLFQPGVVADGSRLHFCPLKLRSKQCAMGQYGQASAPAAKRYVRL